jgi:hypothetical protein
VIYKSRETNSLKRLYIKAKANKLKLTDNGCVRNHKLQGSQPNTKQKLRQVAIMGANWSMKKARMQNHMSIMQHTKSARETTTTMSNKKHMHFKDCKPKRRQLPQESSSKTTTMQSANNKVRDIALMKGQYHLE